MSLGTVEEVNLKFCNSVRSAKNALRRLGSKLCSLLVFGLGEQLLEPLHNLENRNGFKKRKHSSLWKRKVTNKPPLLST